MTNRKEGNKTTRNRVASGKAAILMAILVASVLSFAPSAAAEDIPEECEDILSPSAQTGPDECTAALLKKANTYVYVECALNHAKAEALHEEGDVDADAWMNGETTSRDKRLSEDGRHIWANAEGDGGGSATATAGQLNVFCGPQDSK